MHAPERTALQPYANHTPWTRRHNHLTQQKHAQKLLSSPCRRRSFAANLINDHAIYVDNSCQRPCRRALLGVCWVSTWQGWLHHHITADDGSPMRLVRTWGCRRPHAGIDRCTLPAGNCPVKQQASRIEHQKYSPWNLPQQRTQRLLKKVAVRRVSHQATSKSSASQEANDETSLEAKL